MSASTDLLQHIFRVTLQVRRVVLSVKFPCSLLFQLKAEKTLAQTTMPYELKNSTCYPNEKLVGDVEVCSSQGKYLDKKVTLTILMVSTNGRIPAGSVALKLIEEGKIADLSNVEYFSVEKCPDKSAYVDATVNIELVRSFLKENTLQIPQTQKPKISYVSSYERLSLKDKLKQTPQKMRVKTETFRTMQDGDSPKTMISRYRNGDQESEGSKSMVEQQQLFFEQGSTTSNARFQKLKKQRDGYLKQVASLKIEIQSMRKQQQWRIASTEQQLKKYRAQLDQIMQEHSNTKQKLKNLQRKQKQTITINKEIKDNYQKLKTKMGAAQMQNQQLKGFLVERDRNLRKLEDSVKQLREELEDAKMEIAMHEKRIQFKENTYKEQINKLTDKLQHAEAERQKGVFSLNDLLSEYEANEKKSQMLWKEKERAHQEDKNKLTKKIQSLQTASKKLSEENEDLQTSLSQFQTDYKILGKAKQEVENELRELRIKYDNLEIWVRKHKTELELLQGANAELDQYRTEFSKSKKNYEELEDDHRKNAETLSKTVIKCQGLTAKLREVEDLLKESNAKKDSMSIKNGELSKQVQKYKKMLQSKELELEKLNEKVNNMNSWISQFQLKAESQRLSFEKQITQTQSQLTYLLQSKQQLISELEQNRYKLSNCQQQNTILVSKQAALNNQVLQLNQSLINEQEKNKAHKERSADQEAQIRTFQIQVQALEVKEKDALAVIRTKADQEFQLRKTLKDKQKELQMCQDHEMQTQKHYKQIIDRLEAADKEKVDIIENLTKQLCQQKNRQENMRQTHESSQLKISKLENETLGLRQEIVDSKNYRTNRDLQTSQNGKRISELELKIEALAKYEAECSLKLKDKEQQLKKLKQQQEQYRKQTLKSFQNFLTELPKVELQPKFQLKSVQVSLENEFSLLQGQALRKRAEEVAKVREQVNGYLAEIQYLENQLKKVNSDVKYKEDVLEADLCNMRVLLTEEQQKAKMERIGYIEQIHVLQDRILQITSQFQRLKIQQQSLHSQAYTLQQCLSQKKTQIQTLKKQISQLTKQLQEQAQAQTNLRWSNKEQSNVKIDEYSLQQLDKLKTHVRDLETKNGKFRSQVEELQNIRSELQGQIQQAKWERMKVEGRVAGLESKIVEVQAVKSRLEGELAAANKKCMDEVQQLEIVNQQLSGHILKNSQLTLSQSKLSQCLHTVQSRNKALQKSLRQTQSKLCQTQSNLSKTMSQSQSSIWKLNQQNKNLQSQIIKLKSELQLKEFLVLQLQGNLTDAKASNFDVWAELDDKKNAVRVLQQKNQQLGQQVLMLQQNAESLLKDKESSNVKLLKMNELMNLNSHQAMENQLFSQVLNSKQKQIQKLSAQLEEANLKLQMLSQAAKNNQVSLKTQLSASSNREEQIKKRLWEVEKELQSKSLQLEYFHQQNSQSLQQQKLEQAKTLSQLEQENSRHRSQCIYLREQFELQIEDARDECAELAKLLIEREELLVIKSEQIRQNEKKIKMLVIEFKNCLEAWEREKPTSKTATTIGESDKYRTVMEQFETINQTIQ